mmetsp:Transcript_108027/g.186422  ORF Transcript_108027/g.186422 Transcript_108027/m.186422 type:complete len:103 (-) Transcript_108027:348-656(-)
MPSPLIPLWSAQASWAWLGVMERSGHRPMQAAAEGNGGTQDSAMEASQGRCCPAFVCAFSKIGQLPCATHGRSTLVDARALCSPVIVLQSSVAWWNRGNAVG